MKQDDIPTVFSGGRKHVLERMGLNGDRKSIAKAIIAGVLTITAVIAIVSRDWAQMWRESGVSVERVAKVEASQQEIKAEYVRKDVLEPRLAALEQNVKEIREDQKETNRLLQRLLIERQRR